jgi:hypothetical protein
LGLRTLPNTLESSCSSAWLLVSLLGLEGRELEGPAANVERVGVETVNGLDGVERMEAGGGVLDGLGVADLARYLSGSERGQLVLISLISRKPESTHL